MNKSPSRFMGAFRDLGFCNARMKREGDLFAASPAAKLRAGAAAENALKIRAGPAARSQRRRGLRDWPELLPAECPK